MLVGMVPTGVVEGSGQVATNAAPVLVAPVTCATREPENVPPQAPDGHGYVGNSATPLITPAPETLAFAVRASATDIASSRPAIASTTADRRRITDQPVSAASISGRRRQSTGTPHGRARPACGRRLRGPGHRRASA